MAPLAFDEVYCKERSDDSSSVIILRRVVRLEDTSGDTAPVTPLPAVVAPAPTTPPSALWPIGGVPSVLRPISDLQDEFALRSVERSSQSLSSAAALVEHPREYDRAVVFFQRMTKLQNFVALSMISKGRCWVIPGLRS